MQPLTAKQSAFAREYISCGSAREAARRAGYSQSVCDTATREVLASSAVQAEISQLRREAAERTSELLATSAERAASVLAEIVNDPDISPATRVRAALGLLDRAGFSAPIPLAPSDGGLDDFLRAAERDS